MRIGIVKKSSKWKQKDALLTTMWAATSNVRKHKILRYLLNDIIKISVKYISDQSQR